MLNTTTTITANLYCTNQRPESLLLTRKWMRHRKNMNHRGRDFHPAGRGGFISQNRCFCASSMFSRWIQEVDGTRGIEQFVCVVVEPRVKTFVGGNNQINKQLRQLGAPFDAQRRQRQTFLSAFKKCRQQSQPSPRHPAFLNCFNKQNNNQKMKKKQVKGQQSKV